MLGRIRVERRWQWSAHGKHLPAKDYFGVGDDFPLATAFSEWMGRGYDGLARKDISASRRSSWRFWTREARKDHVACGVVQDSGDAVGRPYPLLIMGSGPLADWDNSWDLVPYACENTWTQIEYLSARPLADLKALEAEVRNIRPPVGEWQEFAEKRGRLDSLPVQAVSERLHHLSETDPFLCLDRQPYDQFDLMVVCHYLSKMSVKSTPNAVFMGGTVEHTYFALFRRALSASDFVRMWTLADLEDRAE